MKQQNRFRALFISDVHLGTRGCQGELLLDFLRHHDAETIYLVGDIVDAWRLRGAWYWPPVHNTIIQKLLRKARKGTRIIYIPGNHDEVARDYCGLLFGGVEVQMTAQHVTADGRRFYVTHGDEFDIVVRHARWLALLGDWAYGAALFTNTYFNRIRRRLGLRYWSFSSWAKVQVKNAVNFIGSFEAMMSEQAARNGYDGVICGHIHHAAMRDINGIRYVNIGDFVESCTAVVEHQDGRLEILTWLSLGPSPEQEPAEGPLVPVPEYA